MASSNNMLCCWHCVVKAILPLQSDLTVWFSSHQQSTTESRCSLSVKTYHQPMLLSFRLFLGGRGCASTFILCVFAANCSNLISSLAPSVCDVPSFTRQEHKTTQCPYNSLGSFQLSRLKEHTRSGIHHQAFGKHLNCQSRICPIEDSKFA